MRISRCSTLDCKHQRKRVQGHPSLGGVNFVGSIALEPWPWSPRLTFSDSTKRAASSGFRLPTVCKPLNYASKFWGYPLPGNTSSSASKPVIKQSSPRGRDKRTETTRWLCASLPRSRHWRLKRMTRRATPGGEPSRGPRRRSFCCVFPVRQSEHVIGSAICTRHCERKLNRPAKRQSIAVESVCGAVAQMDRAAVS